MLKIMLKAPRQSDKADWTRDLASTEDHVFVAPVVYRYLPNWQTTDTQVPYQDMRRLEDLATDCEGTFLERLPSLNAT